MTNLKAFISILIFTVFLSSCSAPKNTLNLNGRARAVHGIAGSGGLKGFQDALMMQMHKADAIWPIMTPEQKKRFIERDPVFFFARGLQDSLKKWDME